MYRQYSNPYPFVCLAMFQLDPEAESNAKCSLLRFYGCDLLICSSVSPLTCSKWFPHEFATRVPNTNLHNFRHLERQTGQARLSNDESDEVSKRELRKDWAKSGAIPHPIELLATVPKTDKLLKPARLSGQKNGH